MLYICDRSTPDLNKDDELNWTEYHAWPSAARGIAMLRVDKFPYPRQQTRGN